LTLILGQQGVQYRKNRRKRLAWYLKSLSFVVISSSHSKHSGVRALDSFRPLVSGQRSSVAGRYWHVAWVAGAAFGWATPNRRQKKQYKRLMFKILGMCTVRRGVLHLLALLLHQLLRNVPRLLLIRGLVRWRLHRQLLLVRPLHLLFVQQVPGKVEFK
jgi:hypothetical protein